MNELAMNPAPSWAKWIAQDYYGDWHYFRWKPSCGDASATWNANKGFWRFAYKHRGNCITSTENGYTEWININDEFVPIKKLAFTGGYNELWKNTIRRLTRNDY